MSSNSRSRKGAWIEIIARPDCELLMSVAPVRERGLKSKLLATRVAISVCRSRKGAWIEISAPAPAPAAHPSLP